MLLDGKPLGNATVQFTPDGKGRDASGTTDKDGRFTLSTVKPGDGVMPGNYKVVITPILGTADPAQYGTSEDAMSGASKTAVKKATGPVVPQKYQSSGSTPLSQEVPVKGSLRLELKSS